MSLLRRISPKSCSDGMTVYYGQDEENRPTHQITIPWDVVEANEDRILELWNSGKTGELKEFLGKFGEWKGIDKTRKEMVQKLENKGFRMLGDVKVKGKTIPVVQETENLKGG